MGIPICAARLTALDHKVIWWLLANQERKDGEPTGVIPKGWRVRAMADLDIPDVTLWRIMKRLTREKVVIAGKYDRAVRINGEAFTSG